MNRIVCFVILLLSVLANSQRIFYVITGDASLIPGIFAFGENGTLLSWFGRFDAVQQGSISCTGTYNYLDGVFYTQTLKGYQIDNPATLDVVETVNSPWPDYGFGIAVKPIDRTQFEIVSGTRQGLKILLTNCHWNTDTAYLGLYTYNRKTGQFTMLNNRTGTDDFLALTVSPLTNELHARNSAGIHIVNTTDGSLRLIKANWIVFQMHGDPVDPTNLYVSQFYDFSVGTSADAIRTLDVNNGVTQPLYYHNTATFTLSPDGFSYVLAFCCSNDTSIRRYNAQSGVPFSLDDRFGFEIRKPIVDIIGLNYANFRYMTVLWSPPRADICTKSGSMSISMRFKRYNWTASMELQVSNLYETVFQTVAVVTPENDLEEDVIKSFDLNLYRNVSTLYRFRIKYNGKNQWSGYSVHKELTISSTSFNTAAVCPNDFITGNQPPTTVPVNQPPTTVVVPVSEPVADQVTATPSADAGVIAPAVIIPVVGSAAIAVVIILLIKRHQKKKRMNNHNEHSSKDTNYTAIVSLSDNKRELTVMNPLNALPKGDRMHIPRANLVIGQEIGKGSYGHVYLGEWNSTTVAIKVATAAGTVTFEKELELMLHLTPHPNVLQILGYSYEGVIPLLVLEYCSGGGVDKIVFDLSIPLSVPQQLTLIAGIARGILHLHNNNVVHRDIAARNVLISSSGEPKVADFGFSRLVETTSGQTDSTVGPVCWMAPESLESQTYSFKTDVWSFGILMYEVLARQEPYKDKSVLDVGPKIRDEGMTPDESNIDASVPHELREIMKSCWHIDPDKRPTFSDICTRLDTLKKDLNL